MASREAALQNLKDRQSSQSAGRYHASRSHELNDKYMAEFDRAWAQLQGLGLSQASVYAQLEDPGATIPPTYEPGSRKPGLPLPSALGSARPTGSQQQKHTSASVFTDKTSVRPGIPRPSAAVQPNSISNSDSNLTSSCLGPPDSPAGYAPLCRQPASRSSGTSKPLFTRTAVDTASLSSRWPDTICSSWRTGPVDPAGVLCDLSDRPNTCCAAHWGRGEVVVGSSDHALYVLDAFKGTRKRTLYNKSCGHTEWVTCVTFVPDGKIVSGGMDSKLWLWPGGSTRGLRIDGHNGPISKVAYDSYSGHVVSCSYDKTIKVWSLGARAHEAGCLLGHGAPVLEMSISSSGKILTGDRSGDVMLWDTSSSRASLRLPAAHVGHVTSLAWFDDRGDQLAGLFVTGGQDGVAQVWDTRVAKALARLPLHVNRDGRGAVGDIIAGGPAVSGKIVTAGADGTVQIVDPHSGFRVHASAALTDFPYSMAAGGGLVMAGTGDGYLHVIDVLQGKILYALGANQAAVRCIEVCADRLVCSGDDGKALLYQFT